MQDEIWFKCQEIQGILLCDKGFPEDTVSWNFELVFSSGPVGYSEIDSDSEVDYKFADSKYWL